MSKNTSFGTGGLLAFVTVVELGSLTAAAERLGFTTSAMSRRISRLEAEVGARLLDRTTRSMSVTEAGERLYEHARAAVTAAQDGVAAVRDTDGTRGHLRVLSLMGFGGRHLVPLLPGFLRRYPEITLDLVLDDSRGRVLAGDFDVALHIGGVPRNTLVARTLAQLGSVVCASPDYLASHDPVRRPDHLSEHTCLVYSYSDSIEHWTFIRDGDVAQVPIPATYAINNSNALCTLAEAGLGLARLPTYIAAPLIYQGRLERVLSSYSMPRVPLQVLLPSRRYVPRKVRVFVDLVVDAFSGAPWEVDER